MVRSFAFIYIFSNLKTVAMVDCLLKKKSKFGKNNPERRATLSQFHGNLKKIVNRSLRQRRCKNSMPFAATDEPLVFLDELCQLITMSSIS
jgi:hypothetical protein